MSTLPEKIGKYQIVSILGQGGMGIVYKAIDPDISQEVALKVIRPELLKNDNDGTFLKRFRNEVLACRRLKHPNIVATYDYHEDGLTCFIVMEYVDGQPLSDFLDSKQIFDFEYIYKIIKQLLSVLSYAHGQGVVHRDIKPDNIMIKEDGVIHVMDFGIARMDTSTLTVAGTVMGSPGYMSPEQCMGKQVDNRSDIFSAGVVLYQLIANERPFTGDNPMATMQKILNVDPVKVSLLNNNIPSSFDLVINKALAKVPKNRYQSAEEFLSDIDDFYLHYLKPHTGAKHNKNFLIVGGIVMACLAGAGYYYKDMLFDGSESKKPIIIDNTKKVKQPVAPPIVELSVDFEKLNKQFAKFDCNTLKAVQNKPNEKIQISGTVQTTDYNKLLGVLEQELSGKDFVSSVEKIDKPFCEIANLLKDGVKQNQTTTAQLRVLPYSHSKTYIENELIMFEVMAPAEKAYIYVDYFTSDGSVVHLYPSNKAENKLVNGSANFILGDKDIKWEVTEPFGTDLVTVISDSKPLFDPLRPNVEDTADYLNELKKILGTSSRKESIKADYFFLTTKAK